MTEIIRSFLKSLIEKKARTFLVLLSIAVSAALIFANESFSRTVTQRFYEADVRWSGISDFYIQAKETVGAKEWIDTASLARSAGQFAYVFQAIKEKALYVPSLEKMHYFTILGVEAAEFNRHNPVTFSQGGFGSWSGFDIVVGKTYADLYHLQLNDSLRLELNNTAYDFKIVGISAPSGLFLRELADGGFILAPRSTLAQIFQGECNLAFLKLNDRTQRAAVNAALTQEFADYQVEYGVNDAVIAAETQNYVMPFRISSIVVVFMCMFIIFTAFNLITMERIPVVGTLRSIGCTRLLVNAVLVVESACLGAVGGLAGCVLGLGVLQYIKYVYFTGDDAAVTSTVLFGAQEIGLAVGAAVVITVLSALLPILRLTRTPIKNIILNDLESKQVRPSRLWLLGAALLTACALVPPFLGSSFTSMIIASSLATGAVVGMVPLVPFLTRHISRLVEGLPWLSPDVALGVRNIRDSKTLLNNVQLFSAAIAIVAFMASMFNTMGSDLLAAFENGMKYDISLVLRHSDPQSLARLGSLPDVQSFTGTYQTHTAILNHQTFLNVLYGIESADFFDYFPVGLLEENRQALASLGQGRYIVTSNVLKGKLGLNIGDSLLIQFGSKEVAYTITGFVETNMGIGHVGYISAENYRQDMGTADYDFIYLKTRGRAASARDNILRALNKEVMSIQTKAEITAANADKVVSMFNAINSYCYLALLIGAIGIVNNLVAGFIDRKRSFAMLRCVGMSKKSLNRMLVTEALLMGLLGVTFGLVCALVMSAAIPAAVSVFWGKVTVQLAVKEMTLMGLVGMGAMLGISAAPVLSSHKLNLIETIKYE